MRMQGKDLTLKNETTVQIRTLYKGDANRLLKFVQHIYYKNDLMELNPNEIELIKLRAVKKKIKEYEVSKRQIMLGVFFEDKIVGVCAISRVSPNEKFFHRASLFIGTTEEFRGVGLGAALMKLAFDFAAKVAYEQFEASILETNTPAFVLFTEYGFKAMCRFPHAYKNMKGAYQDSILLVKYLNNYEV